MNVQYIQIDEQIIGRKKNPFDFIQLHTLQFVFRRRQTDVILRTEIQIE